MKIERIHRPETHEKRTHTEGKITVPLKGIPITGTVKRETHTIKYSEGKKTTITIRPEKIRGRLSREFHASESSRPVSGKIEKPALIYRLADIVRQKDSERPEDGRIKISIPVIDKSRI